MAALTYIESAIGISVGEVRTVMATNLRLLIL